MSHKAIDGGKLARVPQRVKDERREPSRPQAVEEPDDGVRRVGFSNEYVSGGACDPSSGGPAGGPSAGGAR